ncbi:MAG: PIN domain-containing protein [Deltaproteobacteria bacterium]|nr:PIN domain-containing protein [Deltaproteobacteria bacterium]
MKGALVDSSVILDIFENDPVWADWSEASLATYATQLPLFINPVIYAEVSISFQRIEELEEAIAGCGLRMLPMPKEALFLAGKAFLKYRRRKGSKASPLPDFFIGAHAAVEGLLLLTRDVKRMKTYFPTVKTVSP